MKKDFKKSILLFLALAVLTLGISTPAAASGLTETDETVVEAVQETVQADISEPETDETEEARETEESAAAETTAETAETTMTEESTEAEETTETAETAAAEETTAAAETTAAKETAKAASSGGTTDVEAVKGSSSGKTAELTAPSKVTGLKAKKGEHSVTLTWKKSSGAYAYKIYLYDSSSEKYTYIAATKKTTYTVTDLKADTKYTFAVRAYTKSGDQRAYAKYSKNVSATPYSVIPAKVTGVKAEAGDTQITLTWNEAEDATGYIIYSYNTKTGKYTRIKTTKKLKYTITDLKNDKTYTYVIRAYRKYGTEGKYETGKKSKKVTATPKFAEITSPESLKVTVSDSGNTLKWSAVTNATGYIVYRYDISTGKYTRLAKVKDGTTYKDKKAKTAAYYRYKVIVYRKYEGKIYKAAGIVKTVYDPDKMEAALSKVHTMYYSATVKTKAPAYTTSSGTKVAMTVAAGTKITVTYRRSSKYLSTVRINGKTYYMNSKYLNLTSQEYTTSDYTTEEKELFVNGKKYTSSSDYLVWVSTHTQRINVFKKDSEGHWVLYKTAQCGTGLISTPTPLGRFTIYTHMSAKYYNTCSYSYWSKFMSSNAIHQRGKYYSNGAYVNATLGKPVSHGCVRTTDEMAQFIYNKVPLGTTLVVY